MSKELEITRLSEEDNHGSAPPHDLPGRGCLTISLQCGAALKGRSSSRVLYGIRRDSWLCIRAWRLPGPAPASFFPQVFSRRVLLNEDLTH